MLLDPFTKNGKSKVFNSLINVFADVSDCFCLITSTNISVKAMMPSPPCLAIPTQLSALEDCSLWPRPIYQMPYLGSVKLDSQLSEREYVIIKSSSDSHAAILFYPQMLLNCSRLAFVMCTGFFECLLVSDIYKFVCKKFLDVAIHLESLASSEETSASRETPKMVLFAALEITVAETHIAQFCLSFAQWTPISVDHEGCKHNHRFQMSPH